MNKIKAITRLNWVLWGVKRKSAIWQAFPEMIEKIVSSEIIRTELV